MSVEQTIICDWCLTVLAGAPTAASARLDVEHMGGMTALAGGADICADCRKSARCPVTIRHPHDVIVQCVRVIGHNDGKGHDFEVKADTHSAQWVEVPR